MQSGHGSFLKLSRTFQCVARFEMPRSRIYSSKELYLLCTDPKDSRRFFRIGLTALTIENNKRWSPEGRRVEGWGKEVKGMKSTLTMSSEYYMELMNHYIVHTIY